MAEGLQALIISEGVLKNKIYSIRGQKVMLDADLAEIYGYETKAFNRQVKNNIEKFEGEDFMFRLSRSELSICSRCKNCTSRNVALFSGNEGGTRYLPYAFTEQGIYMLMTVLRGELATKQSRALIRMFKQMKDYVLDNQEKLEYRSNLQLAAKEIGDLEDFKKEFPRINLNFIRSENTIHDRFIILDYKEEDEKIYVCGASEKDAGKKLTTIYLFDDTRLIGIVYDEVEKLKTNPSLKLK